MSQAYIYHPSGLYIVPTPFFQFSYYCTPPLGKHSIMTFQIIWVQFLHNLDLKFLNDMKLFDTHLNQKEREDVTLLFTPSHLML